VADGFGRRGGVKRIRDGMRCITHHQDIMMNPLSVMIGDMLSRYLITRLRGHAAIAEVVCKGL
jgi:hypothetical protein